MSAEAWAGHQTLRKLLKSFKEKANAHFLCTCNSDNYHTRFTSKNASLLLMEFRVDFYAVLKRTNLFSASKLHSHLSFYRAQTKEHVMTLKTSFPPATTRNDLTTNQASFAMLLLLP